MIAQFLKLYMDFGYQVFEVFLTTLITTLPMSLIIYFIGKKRVGWVPGEFLLSFLPWIAAMVAIAFTKDERSFSHGIFLGFISGFTLLPRLCYKPTDGWLRFLLTLVVSLILAAHCVEDAITFIPSLRY